MNQPNEDSITKQESTDASDRLSTPQRIFKNHSTSNLVSYNTLPNSSMRTAQSKRYSVDASSAFGVDLDKLSRSPIIPEHSGEHGLGLSGLRRIRQHPFSVRGPVENGISTAPVSRSASLTLVTSIASNSSASGPSVPLIPAINAVEDLNRFPSESLHSFSFAHHSEESIHNRQNALKRSIDFMRDKMGWTPSNPGLVAAQARLGRDGEAQSVMGLLSRANLIGDDAELAHGLGIHGPFTGPADLSGNVFDKTFGLPRSETPESAEGVKVLRKSTEERLLAATPSPELKSIMENGTTLEKLSKATIGNADASDQETLPIHPRTALKRTLTDTDDLSLQSKFAETLNQPYTVNEGPLPGGPPHPATSDPFVFSPLKNTQPVVGGSNTPLGQHTAVPHGHSSRWTPAAQAIFTTEAMAPWTITAANDLACLVFGVTKAEVRRLGILEVVREERRKWLEEKLKDPEAGSIRGKGGYSHSQRESPNPTTTLNVGNGITAKLLSRPPSRNSSYTKHRSQTDDGVGSSYAPKSKVKGGLNHSPHKSRGVLLCGDVVPIKKRNGALGSASIWVKEKKGGLVWVLEEIAEDVAYVSVDQVGCVIKVEGATEGIWGTERVRTGMDFQRLITTIPRIVGTNTGHLDYDLIAELHTFTARTANDINIPVTVEQLSGQCAFRVSSFPHIAGIMVLNSETLHITSSNNVFSSALFGQANPDGQHITEIIPSFDKILQLMTDEDKVRLVDGLVIPEHSFRRARALLAMREGKADAAAIFLRPSGLPARHRDGSEIMVDLQMRVVKSERSQVEEHVIEEAREAGEDEEYFGGSRIHNTEVVYALWITYSRQLHAENHGVGSILPLASQPASPPQQPSPGQPDDLPPLEDLESDEASFTGKSSTSPTRHSGGESQLTVVKDASGAPISPTLPGEPSPTPDAVPSKKTINDFVVLDEMGQGAYGQVKLCKYKRNPTKIVVIKFVTKRRILVDTWTRDRRLGTVPLEIHVLDYLSRDNLKHPNIVEMADFFEDDINYYIEMIPHGLPAMDLFDYIELRANMDEWEARKIFVQVAEALCHLHIKAKVVHRDIKDENVILDGDGHIKLIDFGSAAYIKNGPFDVFVGTIDYAAPEVLGGHSYRGKEQDVWALGILLYTIIYKENPFYSIDEIMDHDLRVPYVMSEASIDLIRLMLNRDVDQRITITEVLEHRWCKGEEDMEAQGVTSNG